MASRHLTWIAGLETIGWSLAAAGWILNSIGVLVFGLVVALVTLFAFAPLFVLDRLGRRQSDDDPD